VNNVDQVVALIEDFVNFGAAFTKFPAQCVFDAVRDDFGVRLVAHSEDIVLGDNVVES